MNYMESIKEIARESNGIITTKDLKNHNIPRIYLSRLVQAGELERIERGIYIDASGYPDDYYFFQKRFGVPIFSYLSALYLYGLTDIIPYKFEVTVYNGYNSSGFPSGTLVHYVSKELYELGLTEYETMFGNKVRVYDLERTVCDFIKDRRGTDRELFSKTIKSYFELKEKNLERLFAYAEKMNILDKVREIYEVVHEF